MADIIVRKGYINKNLRLKTTTFIYYLTNYIIKMKVKCVCGHEQDYKGKNPRYYTCSYCLSKLSIRKARERWLKAERKRREAKGR